MGRKLESNEVLSIGLNVLIPGAGHLMTNRVAGGVLALAAAAVTFFILLLPFLVPGIGVLAALHLYFSLSAEDPKGQLEGQVERRSLPQNQSTSAEPTLRETAATVESMEPVREDDEPGDQKSEPSVAEDATAALDEGAATAEEPRITQEEAIPAPVDVDEASTTAPQFGITKRPRQKQAAGAAAAEPAAEAEPSEAEPSEAEPADQDAAPEEPPEAIEAPPESDFSGEDYPVGLDPEDRQLFRLADAMQYAEQWHDEHGGHWITCEPELDDLSPELLQRIADRVGGARWVATWTHRWTFHADAEVAFFDRVVKCDIGYRFGQIDDGVEDFIWRLDGKIVRRTDAGDEVVAEEIEEFLEELIDGFLVARILMATEATVGPEGLDVLPAEERDRQPEDSKAGFPSFWLGALGPGLDDVGFDFDAPFIRHARGSRVVDQTDIMVIIAFLEWLDGAPESTPGAKEIAQGGGAESRPVGAVRRDDEIVVAWWGESPPEEIDALLEHLRGLTYYEE